MKTFIKNEPLTFNVYGSIIKGTFLSEEGATIVLKVTSDSMGVSMPGEEARINKKFLIEEETSWDDIRNHFNKIVNDPTERYFPMPLVEWMKVNLEAPVFKEGQKELTGIK